MEKGEEMNARDILMYSLKGAEQIDTENKAFELDQLNKIYEVNFGYTIDDLDKVKSTENEIIECSQIEMGM